MTEALIGEQIAYYRAIAAEYEDHAISASGQGALLAAFEQFEVSGDVLELACGPGIWTEKLLLNAKSLTAVDASPEMLARAQERVDDEAVRFIEHDVFNWAPGRRFDTIFFGFWLSHVPEGLFGSFWQMIADCVHPDGIVCFLDDNHRTEQELIDGPNSPVVERRLNDGTKHRAIKIPHEPAVLEQQLRAMGWNIEVRGAGPFYWGSGRLAY